MKSSTYIKGGMFLFAMLMLYFANMQYAKSQNLLKTGTRTNATCIELIPVSDNDGDYTYKSVFAYSDENGQSKLYTTEFSSSPPAYDIDEVVEIVYLSGTSDIKVVSFWGLYRWVFFISLFALPFLIIGGRFVWKNR